MKPNFLNKIENYLGITLVIMLIFLLSIQVISRYIFNNPLGWTEELARYSYIWMIFIGTVLATREREHVRVELLKVFISEKTWNILTLFNDFIILVFWLFLIPASFKYATFAMNIDASGFGFPMFYVFVSLPIAGVLCMIHTVINMVDEYKKITRKENNIIKTA